MRKLLDSPMFTIVESLAERPYPRPRGLVGGLPRYYGVNLLVLLTVLLRIGPHWLLSGLGQGRSLSGGQADWPHAHSDRL